MGDAGTEYFEYMWGAICAGCGLGYSSYFQARGGVHVVKLVSLKFFVFFTHDAIYAALALRTIRNICYRSD
jgi:hypothetical protein